jgi:hypothetical protein
MTRRLELRSKLGKEFPAQRQSDRRGHHVNVPEQAARLCLSKLRFRDARRTGNSVFFKSGAKAMTRELAQQRDSKILHAAFGSRTRSLEGQRNGIGGAAHASVAL